MDVGGEVVASVFEAAGSGRRIAEFGFGDGLDGEAGFAQTAEEIAPAVEEFHGALFAMRAGALGWREGAFVIVRGVDHEPSRGGGEINL